MTERLGAEDKPGGCEWWAGEQTHLCRLEAAKALLLFRKIIFFYSVLPCGNYKRNTMRRERTFFSAGGRGGKETGNAGVDWEALVFLPQNSLLQYIAQISSSVKHTMDINVPL